MITETDDVARALDAAATRWPEDSNDRRRLLLHLVDEGHRAALEQQERDLDQRRAAILSTAGALTGAYVENYLAQLREDWPE